MKDVLCCSNTHPVCAELSYHRVCLALIKFLTNTEIRITVAHEQSRIVPTSDCSNLDLPYRFCEWGH